MNACKIGQIPIQVSSSFLPLINCLFLIQQGIEFFYLLTYSIRNNRKIVKDQTCFSASLVFFLNQYIAILSDIRNHPTILFIFLSNYYLHYFYIKNLLDMQTVNTGKMLYRRFGKSGLQISVISMGQLTSFTEQAQKINEQLIKQCLNAGINHFDCAQIYSAGKAQTELGRVLRVLGVPREDIVISTKILTSPQPDVNSRLAINRKHIREGLKSSLERLQIDYVDVVYAHLLQQNAPLQQVCRGFHQAIEAGESFYWATSNWPASSIIEALAICQKLNLHKPIGTQANYNMLEREQIQGQFRGLLERFNYGLLAWSPLAGGYLTGKYLENNANIEARYNNPALAFYKTLFFDPINTEKNIQALKQLSIIVKQLGYELVHLSLAWLYRHPQLTSAIIGPKNIEQLRDCVKSIEFLEKLTPQLQSRIQKILNNAPTPRMNFLEMKPFPGVRPS